MKSLNKTVEATNTSIIQLDGCLPFLGCTIMLSGKDMNELKLVKHALKKILRMSRQLILEDEYYSFFDLVKNNTGLANEAQRESVFLHNKHMERNFLIFKEVSFSKRKNQNQSHYDGEEDEDPLGNKQEQSQAAISSENEV